MKDKPKVVSVIVNYKNPFDTIECVDSLLRNNYENLDIIIVDNASGDGSFETLRDHYSGTSKVRVIFSKENRGYAGGNNIGIKLALKEGAEYILILNNDTIVPMELVETLVKVSVSLEDKAVIGTKIYYFDQKDKLWFAGGYFSRLRASGYHTGIGQIDNGQFNRQREVTFLTGCLLFVPKRIFEVVGLFDEKFFLYGEDLDFSLRVLAKGFKLVYTPKTAVWHKVSASHKTDSQRVSSLMLYYTNRNRFLIARKWLSAFEKILFILYFIPTRVLLVFLKRNLGYLAGIKDGLKILGHGI